MVRIRNIAFVLILSLMSLTMTSSDTVEAQGLVEYPAGAVMVVAPPPGGTGLFAVIAGLQEPHLALCALWSNEEGGWVTSVDKSICDPGEQGGPEFVMGYNVASTLQEDVGYFGVVTPSMAPLPALGPNSPMKLVACYSYENTPGGEFAKTDLSNCQ